MGALGILGDFKTVFSNILLSRDDTNGGSIEFTPDFDKLPASEYHGLPANAKNILEAGKQEASQIEKDHEDISKPVKTQIGKTNLPPEASKQQLPSDKVRGEDKREEESLDAKTRDSED
jgi:hypothetical protein